MADWDAILTELRLIRASMDKIAALVAGEQAKAELMPKWTCGHRHATREQAITCLHQFPTKESQKDMPPNADAGAFG